jgi:CoA:oxalate CoA-transferase
VPRLAPFGVYPAADGNVVICCSGDKNFSILVRTIDRLDLGEDERFKTQATRLLNYEALDEEVASWTRRHTVDDITRRFEAAGIAAAAVRTPDEAVHDERVLARGEIVRLEHPTYGPVQEVFGPGVPIVFSRTKAAIPPRPATLGEHNQGVYAELLGYSDEDLERLRAEGAI